MSDDNNNNDGYDDDNQPSLQVANVVQQVGTHLRKNIIVTAPMGNYDDSYNCSAASNYTDYDDEEAENNRELFSSHMKTAQHVLPPTSDSNYDEYDGNNSESDSDLPTPITQPTSLQNVANKSNNNTSGDNYDEYDGNNSSSSSEDEKTEEEDGEYSSPISQKPQTHSSPIMNYNIKDKTTPPLPNNNNSNSNSNNNSSNINSSNDPQMEKFERFYEFFRGYQVENNKAMLGSTSKLKKSLHLSGLVPSDESNFDSDDLNPQISSDDDHFRNWNKEFQDLMSLPDSRLKFLKLRNLEHDFVFTAETYGKIIITEFCSKIPINQRTIKPISIGGIAGGEKYISQGILFKFAIDSVGLYSGHDNAMKSASHDLKGLMNYFHCGIEELHYPLMAYIDYRGFRLIAVSLLPISSTTIVYGSADAGKTIHTDEPPFNHLMERIGTILNLKPHPVGGNQQIIHGALDIEGHKGLDGKYYLLDFARVAPPQPPSKRGDQLYKLFRMEFVRKYAVPLSSDAFSGFGRIDAKIHNEEIRTAFQYYLQSTIPSLASQLDHLFGHHHHHHHHDIIPNPPLSNNDNNNNDDHQIDSGIGGIGGIGGGDLKVGMEKMKIAEIFHREGVNLRHMGLVRKYVKSEIVRKQLLNECAARTIKRHYRELQRREMNKIGTPSDEPIRSLTIQLLNLLLSSSSSSSRSTRIDHRRSQCYWNDHLKPDIQRFFEETFTIDELQLSPPHFDLKSQLNVVELIERVCSLCGIEIVPEAFQALRESPDLFEFVDPDLADVIPKTTHFNLIDYADGMSLYYQAQNMKYNPSTQTRLLSLSANKLEMSLLSMSTNYDVVFQLGNVLRSMARHLPSSDHRRSTFEKSIHAYSTILQHRANPSLHRLCYLMVVKCTFDILKEEMKEGRRGAEESKTYIDRIDQLIQKAIEINPFDSAYPLLLKAKIYYYLTFDQYIHQSTPSTTDCDLLIDRLFTCLNSLHLIQNTISNITPSPDVVGERKGRGEEEGKREEVREGEGEEHHHQSEIFRLSVASYYCTFILCLLFIQFYYHRHYHSSFQPLYHYFHHGHLLPSPHSPPPHHNDNINDDDGSNDGGGDGERKIDEHAVLHTYRYDMKRIAKYIDILLTNHHHRSEEEGGEDDLHYITKIISSSPLCLLFRRRGDDDHKRNYNQRRRGGGGGYYNNNNDDDDNEEEENDRTLSLLFTFCCKLSEFSSLFANHFIATIDDDDNNGDNKIDNNDDDDHHKQTHLVINKHRFIIDEKIVALLPDISSSSSSSSSLPFFKSINAMKVNIKTSECISDSFFQSFQSLTALTITHLQHDESQRLMTSLPPSLTAFALNDIHSYNNDQITTLFQSLPILKLSSLKICNVSNVNDSHIEIFKDAMNMTSIVLQHLPIITSAIIYQSLKSLPLLSSLHIENCDQFIINDDHQTMCNILKMITGPISQLHLPSTTILPYTMLFRLHESLPKLRCLRCSLTNQYYDPSSSVIHTSNVALRLLQATYQSDMLCFFTRTQRGFMTAIEAKLFNNAKSTLYELLLSTNGQITNSSLSLIDHNNRKSEFLKFNIQNISSPQYLATHHFNLFEQKFSVKYTLFLNAVNGNIQLHCNNTHLLTLNIFAGFNININALCPQNLTFTVPLLLCFFMIFYHMKLK